MNRDDLMFKYLGSLEIKRNCIRCNSSISDVIMFDDIYPVCDYCRYFWLDEAKEIIEEIRILDIRHKIVIFSGHNEPKCRANGEESARDFCALIE